MKVLIVCNNAYMRGNGICTAVLSLARRLKLVGVQVRIMSTANPDPSSTDQPDYPLKHFKFPIFEPIIETNGFRYATFDRNIATQAIAWADVVHLHEGFPMEAKVARLAREMGKPCVGSFHLFSENVTANLGLGKARIINYFVTRWWRNSVYNLCSVVHCPTEVVKKHLIKCGYTSQMRVITNGLEIAESEITPYKSTNEQIVVLCIGRLSNEKSQSTLIEAMRYSKYADRIQLHFAGKGPCQKRYEREVKKLLKEGVIKYEPVFGFYSHDRLKEIIRTAYLYIHCAWVEVEGLSCAEAIREGVVPIIATGEFTASSQFALDSRSTFAERDSKELAAKIDWWIEHPEQRAEMGIKYAHSIKKYNATDAIAQMIDMYQDSIEQC